MKRAFIIHGWQGRPKDGWRPWLRKELEKRKFSVSVPAMPDTEHPKMDAWVSHLSDTVGVPDEGCYFVGHSLGCIAILRYFETLSMRVGGTVLVAGFADNLRIKELSTFFTKPVDWDKIKSVCKKFTAIHSDDDPYVPLRNGDIFEKNLDAKIVVENGMKHFSGDDGIFNLPSALKAVLDMT